MRYFLSLALLLALVSTPLLAAQGGGGRGGAQHGPPACVLEKKAAKGQGHGPVQNQKAGCDAADKDTHEDDNAKGQAKPHGKPAGVGQGKPDRADGCDAPKPAPSGCATRDLKPTPPCDGYDPSQDAEVADTPPAEVPTAPHCPSMNRPHPEQAAPAPKLPPVQPATTPPAPPADSPPQQKQDTGAKGNNGLGNGEDPQPKGDPKVNDADGSTPGQPGVSSPTGSGHGKGKGAQK